MSKAKRYRIADATSETECQTDKELLAALEQDVRAALRQSNLPHIHFAVWEKGHMPRREPVASVNVFRTHDNKRVMLLALESHMDPLMRELEDSLRKLPALEGFKFEVRSDTPESE